MDGLLVVNKPVGPTSHDVVARVRRALGGERVGHTGTLDPAASGVLPLLVGRATRLAQFLKSAGKRYEARVCLGATTDSYDAAGAIVGATHSGPYPTLQEIDRALDAFRGTFLQRPPAFSAKKIGGRRSYRLARAQARAVGADAAFEEAERPAAVSVTAHVIDVTGVDGAFVTLRVDCSAGFYIRSLAHDLGEQLGIGAHLSALKRTRSGACTLEDAIELDLLEREPELARSRQIPLAGILPELSAIVLTADGVRRAAQGRDLGPRDLEPAFPAEAFRDSFVRLLDSEGRLVGIGEPSVLPDLLHPSVILM